MTSDTVNQSFMTTDGQKNTWKDKHQENITASVFSFVFDSKDALNKSRLQQEKLLSSGCAPLILFYKLLIVACCLESAVHPLMLPVSNYLQN